MWKREEQWCDSVPVFPFSTHKTRTHALSALPLYNKGEFSKSWVCVCVVDPVAWPRHRLSSRRVAALHFSTPTAQTLIALVGWQETSDDSPHSLVPTNERGGEPPGWACIHLGSNIPNTHNSE